MSKKKSDFFYGQQSFIIGPHNELRLEQMPEDKFLVLESNIPIFYAHYYPKLKRRNVSSQQREELYDIMHSTFNPENHFLEIASCSSDVQVQAFNLFTRYVHYEMEKEDSLVEGEYDYIDSVMKFGEMGLEFVSGKAPDGIDFGIKGLVKSDLCKYRNYKNFGRHNK